MEHVEGIRKGHVVLYAISTCSWCNRMKKFLNELGVDYYYEDIDLLSGQAQDDVVEVVTKWNEKETYPTIVIDDKKSIVGNKYAEIKEVLGFDG